MLTTKIGSCLSGRGQPVSPVPGSGQTGFTVADLATAETGLTGFPNRSDRFCKHCQNANWTSPLRSSRRDDQDAYVERLFWTPDERVMTSGRFFTWENRSGRFPKPV
jgi:hypothetical protein